eukprot:m.264971 g.264971  ORF g.264971 m.264971 type:complete len:50 (-) comp11056_c0_seq1:328-477(-)
MHLHSITCWILRSSSPSTCGAICVALETILERQHMTTNRQLLFLQKPRF